MFIHFYSLWLPRVLLSLFHWWNCELWREKVCAEQDLPCSEQASGASIWKHLSRCSRNHYHPQLPCWQCNKGEILPSPVLTGKAFCKKSKLEDLLIDQLFIKRLLHKNARHGFANRASRETALNSQKHPFLAIILHRSEWWFVGWITINLLNHSTDHGEAWASGDFQLWGVAYGFICPQKHVYHRNTAKVRAE